MSPGELLQLLDRVDVVEVARACQVTEETVGHWRVTGVPAGPLSAFLRHLARLNSIVLVERGERRCLLCAGHDCSQYGSSPICSDCAEYPRRAAKAHGFQVHEGQTDEGMLWFGLVCPSFELPVAAMLSRQRRSLFRKADPEVGDTDFDDAVHIETEDYESLFDTFQNPRRRELAKSIAETVTLEINVNQLISYFSPLLFPRQTAQHQTRLELYMVLLGWSLVFEKSRYGWP